MVFWRSFLSILLLMPLMALAAEPPAVTLHLRGGDRITGTVVQEDSKQIKLKTTWQGEVVVPIEWVEKRELTAITTKTNQPVAVTGTNTAPAVAASKTNAPAKDAAASKPASKPAWSGEAQLGADISRSDKNRDQYYARFKLTYAKNRFRNIFDYKALYGTSEGDLIANRMDGSIKTDYDLNDRIFAYNLAGAGYDEVRKIDYQYEMGPGIGYHIFKGSNAVLNAELGFNYTQIEYSTADDRQELNLRLAEDFNWKINSRLSFDEKLEFIPTLDDLGTFRARFEANFRYQLSLRLSLNLTVIDIYDTRPAASVTRNDLQIRSSLGVKF